MNDLANYSKLAQKILDLHRRQLAVLKDQNRIIKDRVLDKIEFSKLQKQLTEIKREILDLQAEVFRLGSTG